MRIGRYVTCGLNSTINVSSDSPISPKTSVSWRFSHTLPKYSLSGSSLRGSGLCSENRTTMAIGIAAKGRAKG
jgi:hypothetical protein